MLARAPFIKPLSSIRKVRSLSKDRRRVLIESVAALLREGRPTHFAYEASCRHGIRSALCVDGWKWQEADQTADDVVSAAFRQLGATRPTWLQGQLEYTEATASRCLHCRRAMPDYEEGGRRRYCSHLCSIRFRQIRYMEDHREEAKAASQVWRDTRREAQPPRACEWCGTMFKPLDLGKRPQRFCGKSCIARWTNSRRSESFGYMGRKRKKKALPPPRSCLECGRMFRPDFPEKRYCAKLCSNRANSKKSHRPKLVCQTAGLGTHTEPKR